MKYEVGMLDGGMVSACHEGQYAPLMPGKGTGRGDEAGEGDAHGDEAVTFRGTGCKAGCGGSEVGAGEGEREGGGEIT